GHLLADRHGRQLDRKSARRDDAALHLLGSLAHVAVAGVGVAPRVDDGDHRLPDEFLPGEAHLHHPGAVAEAAHGVDAEPAVAAQVLGFADGHRRLRALHGCWIVLAKLAPVVARPSTRPRRRGTATSGCGMSGMYFVTARREECTIPFWVAARD